MPPKATDSAAQKEDCILLAIKAYQSNQISSVRAAAEAFGYQNQHLVTASKTALHVLIKQQTVKSLLRMKNLH